MLHLGGRIAFSMYIRYFLQFQSTFQGYWVTEPTAEIEEITSVMRLQKKFSV